MWKSNYSAKAAPEYADSLNNFQISFAHFI